MVGPMAGGLVPRCLLRSGRATKPPTKTGLPPACRREVRGEGARAATRALPRFPLLTAIFKTGTMARGVAPAALAN